MATVWICTMLTIKCWIIISLLTIMNKNAKVTLYQWKATIYLSKGTWPKWNIYSPLLDGPMFDDSWCMAVLSTRPLSQNWCLSPGLANFQWQRSDMAQTWNLKLVKRQLGTESNTLMVTAFDSTPILATETVWWMFLAASEIDLIRW